MKRLIAHVPNEKKEIRDFVFHAGLNVISQEDRSSFDFTSENIAIGDLSFEYDGGTLTPFSNGGGKVFELSVVSKGILELEAVFFLGNEENLANRANAVRTELSELRSLPLNDKRDEEEKIRRVFEILAHQGVSYFLLDFSAENNLKHRSFLMERITLLDDTIALCLPYVPKKTEEDEDETVVRNDRALFPHAKAVLKEQGLNLLFAAVFSLIGSFGLTYGINLLKTDQLRGGIFSLILSAFCLFMVADVSISSYREKRALLPGNSYLLLVLFIGVAVISSGISCLITYLMNKEAQDLAFLLGIALLFGVLIVVLQFFGRYLAIRAKDRGKTL